jgi:hypothetical protein
MRPLPSQIVLLPLLLASGCAGQISEMPTWVAFDEDNVEGANDVAVIMVRVEPAEEVLLAAGRVERDGWRGAGPKSQVWLPAKDGFVVARVTPTQDAMAYAVIGVRAERHANEQAGPAPTYEAGFWPAVAASGAAGSDSAGTEYAPAEAARVPLLTAVAGRVTFVGALRLVALPGAGGEAAPAKIALTPVASPEALAAARQYLAEHYSKIRARVVERPLQMVRRRPP